MRFVSDYYNPMDRVSTPVPYEPLNNYDPMGSPEEVRMSEPKEPMLAPNEIGQTITEGQGSGTLLDSLQATVKMGASRVELALQEQGSQPRVGAEHYGKDTRRAIKEVAQANNVRIHSVHSPTSVGNISGLGRNGFSEQQREHELNEVKRAINFAADVAPKEGAVSIVVHTGEYPRNISDVNNPNYEKKGWKFEAYNNEENEKIFYLVDKYSGEIISQVKKNEPIEIPVWNTAERDYNGTNDKEEKVKIKKGDYIDYLGRKITSSENLVPKIDKNNNIEFRTLNWNNLKRESEHYKNYFGNELKKYGMDPGDFRPEVYVYWSKIQAKEKSAEGWANYHFQGIKEDIDRLKKIDSKIQMINNQNLSEEELNKYFSINLPRDQAGVLGTKRENWLQYLENLKRETEKSIKYKTEAAMGSKMEAEEIRRIKQRIAPVDKFAKEKTFKSLAELGVYAFRESKEKKLEKPIFIAPENIFPDMGYGSHPDELIEMVQKSREEMTKLLTTPKIKKTIIGDNGKTKEVSESNPYYDPNVSKKEAEKIANESIKSTFDTQHMGMWYRYFRPKNAKTESERMAEFKKWYLEQVKKLEKAHVIGNIHMVDGFGRAHTHLAAGQGEMPIRTAIEYLKKKGYSGNISSEGHEEGSIRQLLKAWQYFDSPIYGVETGRVKTWTDVQHSYFDQISPGSHYVVGNYLPSEDWKFWSEVPLE
ncbi:MAG: hypothetical protein GWP09_02480 [Nitrospiraceae bacterium]|nr:hypothetical protein [Nitrospiraceae bacterium]